jgi:hypothetical protein
MIRLAAAAALLALAGCNDVADLTGLATGAAAGGATANPAVGFLAGVTTSAAVDAGLNYVSRTRQHAEQDAIAAAAGGLPDGGSAPWRIRHDIPIGNEGGQVQVVRTVDTPLAACKEIVFSVADAQPAIPAWYETTICRQAAAWQWALAEPAVPRWGSLQQ